MQRLSGARMLEFKLGCMEEIAAEAELLRIGNAAFGVHFGLEGDLTGGTVERVADNGVAEGLRVDANLMGASGFNAHLDKGEGTIGSGETFENVEV